MTDVWTTAHDPIGEALHALRMNQSAFYLTEFTAPWGL
ncbi:MAG: AraC family transcriptional regulator, partial [Candidatus Melainabacteria bacterium HGW-Melainabacteria-1]